MKKLVFAGYSLLMILFTTAGWSEVGARECITPGPPAGQAYRLQADGQWRDLGSLDFNHNSASDYVITGVVEFSEGNHANGLVEYQFTLDGGLHGWYTRRTPQVYPTTEVLRTIVGDIPAGIHSLTIRARNLSPYDVYYSRVWLSPLLVDSAESTSINFGPAGNITVGSAWTTLAQTTLSVPSGKMVYLSGFETIVAGTALSPVEYRIVGAATLDQYSDSAPPVFSDGVHVSVIDKTPPVGTATYSLQARSLSGSTFTVGARELTAQTLPQFTVFDATGGGLSFANDDTWHTIAQTGWINLSPASHGTYGTDGGGFANFTYDGALAAEAEAQFLLEFSPNPLSFEVGWIGVNPSGYQKLVALNSDWEQLGLVTSGETYRMNLQVRGLCENNMQPVMLKSSHFQIAVLPDNTPYTSASCAANSAVCCANNYPACQKYDCKMLLPLASGIPSRDCF